MSKIKQISKNKLRLRLASSVFFGLCFFLAIFYFFRSVNRSEQVDGAPKLLRNNFLWNEKVGQLLYSSNHLAPTRPPPPKNQEPRHNGDLGIDSDVEDENYRVLVESGKTSLSLSIPQIEALSRSSAIADFKCVEGWSEVIQYAGVKFTDFMTAFGVGKKADGSYYKYVGLETPDKAYYVSIDMESMQSPQTMLAYEMNQAELRLEDGYPIRLIIPNKYGIKNLKRIGKIFFSDERPRDYWAERGYDWYSGL